MSLPETIKLVEKLFDHFAKAFLQYGVKQPRPEGLGPEMLEDE